MRSPASYTWRVIKTRRPPLEERGARRAPEEDRSCCFCEYLASSYLGWRGRRRTQRLLLVSNISLLSLPTEQTRIHNDDYDSAYGTGVTQAERREPSETDYSSAKPRRIDAISLSGWASERWSRSRVHAVECHARDGEAGTLLAQKVR